MPGDIPSNRRRRSGSDQAHDLSQAPLSARLDENLQAIRHALGHSDDLVMREFRLGPEGAISAAAVSISGLVEPTTVGDFILRSLTSASGNLSSQDVAGAFRHIKEVALDIFDLEEQADLNIVLSGLMDGRTAILVDGHSAALVAGTAGWKSRAVSEATVENVVRGSREAFTEDLTTNIAAVRRRVRHPALRVQKIKLGKITQTSVAILHIEGVVREEVLREVLSRLSRIDLDGVLESGYIEEMIMDTRWSPFPQIGNTERPDRVAGALLEGQVAILTDGTPFALLAPFTFPQFLQSPDDYFEIWPAAMFVRSFRLVATLAALYLPSFYVAAITYHHEMIPLGLALNIAGSREGSPFPAFVEALLLELTFELLREAGIRLPRPVGQAVSIVGGLVIGDAAVRAGIVGAPMVIIVAGTGIASFAIPAFNLALTLRVIRFVNLAIGAVSGLPGIALTSMALLCHLASLRSFGVPYLYPVGPGDVTAWKDLVVRAPWWSLKQRPRETAADRRRQPPYPARRPR